MVLARSLFGSKKRAGVLYSIACLFAVVSTTALAELEETRTLRFVYEVLDADLPEGQAVDIYVPVPTSGDGQQVLESTLKTSLGAELQQENEHGNQYYHLHRAAGSDAPLSARFEWVIEREIVTSNSAADSGDDVLQQYLQANTLVPVGHEVLEPILQEIYALRSDDSKAATARAIYDWVVDNVEYKKVGTGWGNGDTFWACSERYGNCTDFHALFVSLARSEGIPAKFEIGFPVPTERSSGEIGGYHCWVKFFLPGRGWVPIDASEAAKDPSRKELYYGTHPADRIHLTTGRDLIVSEASARMPLNYFVYPYVELDGKPWQGKVEKRFSYSGIVDGDEAESTASNTPGFEALPAGS
jgi:transglutaminase-like putative cysteine protease